LKSRLDSEGFIILNNGFTGLSIYGKSMSVASDHVEKP